MKNQIRGIAAMISAGIFMLLGLAPSAQSQTARWWYYGCPQGPIPQIPGNIPNPGSAGWAQYETCLQQKLNLSSQQSTRVTSILASEGRKVITIRNDNSLTNVQKVQAVKATQQQFDQQLKAILSSAQYDQLKAGRQQAIRWVTQARLGWQ
jgi:hypothetical protein